ncbi:MAG TPA: ATP12 family protein [Sphingomicrobium sp.]|nr:ATP12 family protein [Sphingomicrobium sp.]
MKRFWTEAVAVEAGGEWGIELDGRPIRTPARALLRVPSRPLADAIVGEWNAAEEKADPRAMPLTGLANAAIDRVAPDKAAFAQGLAAYGESDLACYRAEGPPSLVARQKEHWDALLAWARRRFDVDFRTTGGIVHVAQPQATVDRLAHAVHALDAFRLAALSPLVTIGGSLIGGLAVVDAGLTADEAWQAVSIDERWQLEQWGSDAEAEAALDNSRRDFLAAARFLELLDG